MNKLIDCLDRGESLCSQLRELALAKRRLLLAATAGDERVLALEKLQDEELALFSRLKKLTESKVFAELVTAAVPELAARYSRFGAAIKELKRLNRENGVILHELQEYVSSTLVLLERNSEELTYQDTGKQGEVKKVVSRKSFLDHQV